VTSAALNNRNESGSRYWRSKKFGVLLYQGDCLSVMSRLEEESFDVIFADPPYFLSNGGTTCKSGARVSVNKGKWDKSRGIEENHDFNREWLQAAKRLLKPNGSIWVSGTSHVIFSVGFALQQLEYKILNQVTWQKPNPPPNLSCRYLTHSTETLVWAARDRKSKHHFEYAEMRARNEHKQMKDVWQFCAPGKREKVHGKHPTQKPFGLLERVIAASCPEGGRVLDPFNGSGTTGLAAVHRGMEYVGIDLDESYLELTKSRIQDGAPADARSLRKTA